MQSNYQRSFIRQPRVQAIAVNAQRQSNGFVVAVAYALMSGIIVLWMSQLSSVTGSILSKLNILPDRHAAFSHTVNRENMGDRLPAVTFDDRWNALGKLEAVRPTATIPGGCQPGARCGAKANPHTELAAAE